MGSLGCLGALAPQFLARPADKGNARVDVMKLSVDSEWHSIPLEDSSRIDAEYCFKLSGGKDSKTARGSLFGDQPGAKEASHESRKVELSLCGFSKNIDGGGEREESKALVRYPDGLKKDCSFITMETLDGSNGVKEVRVTFHESENMRNISEKGASRKGEKRVSSNSTANLGFRDEGCVSLLKQLRSFIQGTKLLRGGVVSGDSKNTVSNGRSSFATSGFASKTSDSSPITGSEMVVSRSCGKSKTISAETTPGTKDDVKRVTLDPLKARDPQSRSDALPLAHYRPDTPAWCRESEQRKEGPGSFPAAHTNNSPVNMNCKKPPKPPKPPRHPGRSSSLDSATIQAQRAAKKKAARAAAKRRARVLAPPSSGTPFIALALTLGFGLLMVFQGVFVQSTASSGRSNKNFVEVPLNHIASLSIDKASSYGYPNQLESQSSSLLASADSRAADMVLSNAFHKSMQELERSRNPLASDTTTGSG